VAFTDGLKAVPFEGSDLIRVSLADQRVHNLNCTIALVDGQVLGIEDRSPGTFSSLKNQGIPERNLVTLFDIQGLNNGRGGIRDDLPG
jgi:hypothetical protein